MAVGGKAAICGLSGQKPRATKDSCLIVTERSMEAPKGRGPLHGVIGDSGSTQLWDRKAPLGQHEPQAIFFVVYYILTIGRSNTSMMIL